MTYMRVMSLVVLQNVEVWSLLGRHMCIIVSPTFMSVCMPWRHHVLAPSYTSTIVTRSLFDCLTHFTLPCTMHLLCYALCEKVQKVGIPLDMIYCESLTHYGLVMPYDVKNGSTMAACLTATSHYLNHSLLSNSMVQYHSHEGDFNIDPLAISNRNLLDNYLSNPIFCKLPRGQWKKLWQWQHWVHGKVSMP